MHFAGIDAGSRACKVAFINEAGQFVARAVADQGPGQGGIAERLFAQLLSDNGLARADVAAIVATGYGRDAVDGADAAVTEITCHARGARFFLPEVRSVVEIGGQDSKFLRLSETGAVEDFRMNDRCAAGTGRFLEMVASRLGADVSALEALAESADAPVAITSMCAVFAESEIIGLLAKGASPGNVAAGALDSVAARMKALAGRGCAEPAAFMGGAAKLGCLRVALERALGCKLAVPAKPQFTGAVGAALIARERFFREHSPRR